MDNTQIIGYRVKTWGNMFVNASGMAVTAEPDPCAISEAYRRMGLYLESYPNAQVPSVIPVTRALTPIETASQELGCLLTSLCKRHGLDLGLSKDQIERQIAKELTDLGATGVGILGAIPRR